MKNKHLIIEDNLHKATFDKTRQTVRAIIINDQQEVLMLYSHKFNDYTFPGGGVKYGETLNEALQREVSEETGIIIKNERFYDTIHELRYGLSDNNHVYLQESNYFLCQIDKLGKTNFTNRELEHDLITKYVNIEKAINHNEHVLKDEIHQQKGLKTVLLRENAILEKLLEDLYNEKI